MTYTYVREILKIPERVKTCKKKLVPTMWDEQLLKSRDWINIVSTNILKKTLYDGFTRASDSDEVREPINNVWKEFTFEFKMMQKYPLSINAL